VKVATWINQKLLYNRGMPFTYQRIAMIARWKPVHLGHQVILRALCELGKKTFIGIGSSNRYNIRNPFTLEETRSMIQLALAGYDNYDLIPVPDLDDGPRWRVMVKEMFGDLDLFVTDNPYVTNLLKNDYRITRPVELIPLNEHIRVDGAMVRERMARDEDWASLVPQNIAAYIKSNRLDVRFREEFGLQTLALETFIQ
jgi:nicotinamide-nucleotide adenylyltransferase